MGRKRERTQTPSFLPPDLVIFGRGVLLQTQLLHQGLGGSKKEKRDTGLIGNLGASPGSVCVLSGAPLYPPVFFNISSSGTFTHEGHGCLELEPPPIPSPCLVQSLLVEPWVFFFCLAKGMRRRMAAAPASCPLAP